MISLGWFGVCVYMLSYEAGRSDGSFLFYLGVIMCTRWLLILVVPSMFIFIRED